MTPYPDKAGLRLAVQAALRGTSAETRRARSAMVCARLRERVPFSAGTVLFFAPLADEVDIWPLLLESLAAGRPIALPRFDAGLGRYVAAGVTDLPADLATGKFGIREPAPHCPVLGARQVDWILVPGVAFDRQGNRLGRGQGFYDRLLAEIQGVRCAVAFDEQLVRELPAEPHDRRMDLVVTPTQWLELRRECSAQ